jgi:MFS family permease
VAETQGGSLTQPAGGRDLTVFLTAKTISDIGYALDFICLSVFIWVRTGSTLATGMVSLVLYAGTIVGGRLAHRYGDQWDRRLVMIGADAIRASMLTVLALLPGRAQVWWLYPAVALIGTGQSVFASSLSAATPVLAGSGARTQSLNGVLAGARGVAFIIGMGLASVLVPVIGYRGVFGCDAASYALSGLVLTALRFRMRERRAGSERPDAAAPAPWPLLVAAGLATLVALRGLDAFASSSQQVGLPVLGGQLRPDDPTLVAGIIWSCWAAGLLVASFVLRPLSRRIISLAPGRVFCLATIVMSAGFIGVFWLPGWWPRLVSAFVAGLGDALSEITFKQALQAIPDHQRGRAFGLSQTMVSCGFTVGLLLTSVALRPDWLPQWVLLLHGAPLIAAGWLAAVPGRRRRVPESA